MVSQSNHPICHLCGCEITEPKADIAKSFTGEHVPPKQFYPKSLRAGLNLWTNIPAHKKCNNDFQEDEDYFYHALAPMVQTGNQEMGRVVFDDLRRRAIQPQTRFLIRQLLNTSEYTSPGGILLPPGMVRLSCDERRLQRVAIKVAQGVFFHRYNRFLPRDRCKDIRLCESPKDAPELYSLSWQLADEVAVNKRVFSYRAASLDNNHYLTLVFWEAFAFCMTFEDPQPQASALPTEVSNWSSDGEDSRSQEGLCCRDDGVPAGERSPDHS